MYRWPLSAKILGGFFAVALAALPQEYTISAKPGAVNFIDGQVSLDGQPLSLSNLRSVFLNAGSLLETRDGRAEVLLTPGVFLRVGDSSQVRMLRPSLIDTQIAIEAGESILEVDEFVRDVHFNVSIRGSQVQIQKNGLYRFRATGDGSVAVLDGKALVSSGSKNTQLGKGREALLTDALKTRKFDKEEADELYAWSNIRAQYNASLSYQAARSMAASSSFGSSSFYGNGWYWANGFNSWLWMPASAAFSPFGWGFYGPGYVSYAPVVVVPAGGGGGYPGGWRHGHGDHDGHGNHDGHGRGAPGTPGTVAGIGTGTKPTGAAGLLPGRGTMTVPINARQMPAIGVYSASPGQYAAARAQAMRSVNQTGMIPNAMGSRNMGMQPHSMGGGGNNGGGHPGAANGNAGGARWGGGGSPSGGGMSGGAARGGGGGMGGGGGAAAHSSAGGSTHSGK